MVQQRAGQTDVVVTFVAVEEKLKLLQVRLLALVASRHSVVPKDVASVQMERMTKATVHALKVRITGKSVLLLSWLFQVGNSLSGGLQLGLQGCQAVVRLLLSWLVSLFAFVARQLEVGTLLRAVVVHIPAKNSHTATKSARLHQLLTSFEMADSCLVSVLLLAPVVLTLEEQLLQFVHHEAVHFPELHFFVAVAFLGAVVVATF